MFAFSGCHSCHTLFGKAKGGVTKQQSILALGPRPRFEITLKIFSVLRALGTPAPHFFYRELDMWETVKHSNSLTMIFKVFSSSSPNCLCHDCTCVSSCSDLFCMLRWFSGGSQVAADSLAAVLA